MNIKLITAASESYSKSLFALIGSLNLNWHDHPPIEVYDIGLSKNSLEILRENKIVVHTVPQFCDHWRAHFTWKFWCWKDINADIFLYIDAGIIILKPLDDVLEVIKKLGYAVVPNYRPLEEEASEIVCKGCALDPDFRIGKATLAGGFIGFDKGKPIINSLIDALFELSLDEKNLKAFHPSHRHDQALTSLMIYKIIGNPIILDGNIYLGSNSPMKVPGQKVWACRKSIELEDVEFFQNYLDKSKTGNNYLPKTPSKAINSIINENVYQLNRIFHKNTEEINQIMLKKSLGKQGSRIMGIIFSFFRFFYKFWNEIHKKDVVVQIYDGIKE